MNERLQISSRSERKMALTLAAASFAFQAPMLARPMASSVVMSAANGLYVAKLSIASRIARRFPGGLFCGPKAPQDA